MFARISFFDSGTGETEGLWFAGGGYGSFGFEPCGSTESVGGSGASQRDSKGLMSCKVHTPK